MVIGPLTFLNPLALLGLLALPLIWWILRITPPKPILQTFPPLRLLIDINKNEDTPQSTPLWLLLFRLFLGALIALALANPIVFKPETSTSRPILLVIDNGFASAGNWANMMQEADAHIKQALSENQQVAIVTSVNTTEKTAFVPASEALKTMRTLRPMPYAPQRTVLSKTIKGLDLSGTNIYWLSDGIDYGKAQEFAKNFPASAESVLLSPASEVSPIFAGKTQQTANGFRSAWHRVDSKSIRTLTIAAYGAKGRVIARAPAQFTIGAVKAEAQFDLPADLRNQVAQLKPEGIASAGSVVLLDDSWGRPLVGLLKGSDANTQPLLSEWHFIEKALSPNADIYKGDLQQLLAVEPSMIFMTDRARMQSAELKTYVEKGGLLVRFAGPKLAKRSDDLLPIILRSGNRELGGALAWKDPQGFAAFAKDSPFFGLDTHEDVLVKRQVMARPGAQTDAHTWARLKDGSPVITSAPAGLGRIVLFHVTAGPDWSDLPLSGLYVNMLKRILPLARATTVKTQNTSGDWTAERTLNGYGQLETPPRTIRPIANADFSTAIAQAETPPGLYRQGLRRQALNTIADPNQYSALSPSGFTAKFYGGKKPKNLSGSLLGLAALLLIFDVFLSLLASGRLRSALPRAAANLPAIMLCAVFLLPLDTRAQTPENNDALDLHLAYIATGNSAIDSMSKAGLEGLAFELNRRTTIEPKGVRRVNPETDTLAFYPFLYWPVERSAKPLSPLASRKLNAYMAAGGTLVFDTQDQDRQKMLGGETHPGLATLSKSLDIPRLSAPPKDHVITKSYYLIQTFPGRYADGKIWVEADQRGSARDGVSSVIVGANDWAAAWAKDKRGRSLAVIENDIPQQREFAYRFGINLAMYALAGNYKSDQVHAAALVSRLGTGFENDPAQKAAPRPENAPPREE